MRQKCDFDHVSIGQITQIALALSRVPFGEYFLNFSQIKIQFPSLKIYIYEKFYKLKQELITRSVHLHCIREPTYAQTELFLDMYFPRTSVSVAVRI